MSGLSVNLNISPVKPEFIDLAKVQHVVTESVKGFAYRIKQIGNDFAARAAAERMLIGFCRVISVIHPAAEAAGAIISVIGNANKVLDCFKLLGSFPYFFVEQLPKRDRLFKIDGEIYRKEQPVDRAGKTKLQYHLEKGEIFKIASNITSTTLTMLGAIAFMDTIKLIDLAKTIGSFAPKVLSKISVFGWMAFFGVKTIISVKYLVEAYQGDWTKDKTKGWLQLAANVSMLAVMILSYVGVPLIALGVTGIVAGGIALTSYFYASDRRVAKEEANQELLQEVSNNVQSK